MSNPKQPPRLGPTDSPTRTPTRDEFLFALQAERADHTPPPGTPTATVQFEILEHRDRWGTIRYGSVEQHGDAPAVRFIDKKAVAAIEKRNARLKKRAQLARRAQSIQMPRTKKASAKRKEKTMAIENEARAYLATHAGCSPAELAKHLRREFKKKHEKDSTYYQRVYMCLRRIRKPLK